MWRAQVLVDGKWEYVRPGGNAALPYRFKDESTAYGMLELCYPDALREMRLGGEKTVRVVEEEEMSC